MIGSSAGRLLKYNIQNGNIFSEENKSITLIGADSGIIALTLDELNVEGLVGT